VETKESGRAAAELAVPLYAVVSFVALAGLALTERFGSLPGALVACASGWYIVRLESPGPGEA